MSREKTGFLHIQKGADQLCSNCKADQRLCFCYTDSTIPLLSKSKSLSFLPSSVAAQVGLCRAWSETPEDRFSPSRGSCWKMQDQRRLISILFLSFTLLEYFVYIILDEVPESYWRDLAEERRLSLAEALSENEMVL